LGSCCEAGQQDCVSARSGLVASEVEDVTGLSATCPFEQAPVEEGKE
jgi:nitrite reductase/ring-hydroxylating ferredoxin subunit